MRRWGGGPGVGKGCAPGRTQGCAGLVTSSGSVRLSGHGGRREGLRRRTLGSRIGLSMKSDCAAGQQGRTLDQDAEAFSPSFQVLSRCPRRRTFRAGFLWWVGEKRESRVSAAHLSWSRFQIKAGAVGGARDHALGPAGGAAPRGKPFGKPGPTLRARNCPGGSGVVCRGEVSGNAKAARCAGIRRQTPALRFALCTSSFEKRGWHRGKGTPCAQSSERRGMLPPAGCAHPTLQSQTSPQLRG